jgi:DNA repair protein RadC
MHTTQIQLVKVTIQQQEPGIPLENPASVAKHARSIIGNSDREHLLTYHLNNQHQIISYEETSIGHLSASIVHPREIFKAAILSNAASIIVAHNHPSGNKNPSVQDKDACRRIQQASNILGILLLDFVIVTLTENYSFGTSGKLDAGAKQDR